MVELPSHIDGWVVQTGRRHRAMYQAESEDGTAYLMKFNVHQRSTAAWFPAHLVELVRRPERVVKEPSRKTRERIDRARASAQEAAAAD